jgi:hypothetical protein
MLQIRRVVQELAGVVVEHLSDAFAPLFTNVLVEEEFSEVHIQKAV